MDAAVTLTTIQIPTELHARAKKIARIRRASLAQLVREGLRYQVETVENKMREEKERAHEEKIEKRHGSRVARTMRKIGDTLRENEAREKAAAAVPPPPRDNDDLDDRLRDIYEEHGSRIFEVLDSPLERHTRTAEALRAISRAAPLTGPTQAQALRELERVVLRLHEEAPRKKINLATPPKSSLERTIDALVGKIINPTRIRTSGDAKPDDDNE